MPSRRRLLRTCAAGLAVTAGCASVGTQTSTDTDRSTTDSERRSADRTSADGEMNDTEDPPERVGTERVRWETDVAYSAENRPTLADERVLAGTTTGVAALSSTDGEVQWSTETAWPVQAPPRVVGPAVVAVSGRFGEPYTVHGLDPATGEQRWEFEPHDHRLRVLAGDGERVFVVTAPPEDADASADGSETLFAVSSTDGSVRWSVNLDGGRDALVTEGTAYVAGRERVVAVGASGTRLWEADVDTYQTETLTRAGDTLVVVTEPTRREPRVHGLSAATGEQRWTFDEWRAFTTRTVNDQLFVGGERLARLAPSSGAPAWTVDAPVARLLPGYDDNRWVDAWRTALATAPLVDGTLYVGGPDAAAVSVDDGTVDWRHDSELAFLSPVAAARDRLILHGSADSDDRGRHLVCVDTTTGQEAWRFAGRFRLTEPTVGATRAYLAESRSGLLALAL